MQHEHLKKKTTLYCIISKFEAKTEWIYFSFAKLYINKYQHETNDLNETHIHSLPAGGTLSISLLSASNTHAALLVLISSLFTAVQSMYYWNIGLFRLGGSVRHVYKLNNVSHLWISAYW